MALVVAALVTPLVRRLAHRFGLYDSPAQLRKVHRKPIPRLGGVAITIGFFAPLTALLLYSNDISTLYRGNLLQVVGLYLGGMLVLFLGVLDDIRGMSALSKLAGQVVVATLMYQFGYVIDLLAIPFYGPVHLGLLSFPVTLLWFVGIMNAVNLIDGLDGLAGGVSFFAVATLFAVGLLDGNQLTSLFSAALAGAIVGFLFYNFNPATIFMGDCGSLFLGFVIAAVAVKTSAKSSTAIALTVPVLALGLPIVDAFLAIVRRIRRGKSVFSADREHIHHRLLALGFTQRQAVLILYTLCGVLALTAIVAKATNDVTNGVIILGAVVVLFALSRLFRFHEMVHQRRMAMLLEDQYALPADARIAVRDAGQRIRAAASVEQVWEVIKELADVLGIRDTQMRLYLRRSAAERVQQHYRYHSDRAHLMSELSYQRLEVPLLGTNFVFGELTFSYRQGAGDDADERYVLVNLIGEHVAEYIEANLLGDKRQQFVVSRIPARVQQKEA